MPTIRVNINQTNGRVGRTLPSLLRGQLSQEDWRAFAAKLEHAVKPAIRLRWLFPIVSLGLFLVTLSIFATTFATASASGPSSHSGPPVGPFVVVPILWVVAIVGLFACTHMTSNHISEDLQSICDQASRKYPNLSFHLQEEQYYMGRGGYRTKYYVEIQTSASPMINPSSLPPQDPAVSPMYTPEIDVEAVPIVVAEPEKNLTVVARLERLENLRSHLTGEEYARKRQDILNSL
mgnify:CR=1 FL=1